jgi:hypothetical protein
MLVTSCLFTCLQDTPAEGYVCHYTTSNDLQLALVEVDDVRVAVGQQTLCTPLTADTTFLVASEDAMNHVIILSREMAEG